MPERPVRAIYHLSEAAAKLGIRYSALKAYAERTNWIVEGRVPALKVAGKIKVPAQTLDEWLEYRNHEMTRHTTATRGVNTRRRYRPMGRQVIQPVYHTD